MPFKKIAFVICVLCQVLYSCDTGSYSLEYYFNNKSSYAIQITLFEPYKTDTEEKEKKTSPFWVYSSDEIKVYVHNNGIVDFQWTTNYPEANPKVYCETNGPKAVFRDIKEEL